MSRVVMLDKFIKYLDSNRDTTNKEPMGCSFVRVKGG